jgi:hypothetical protein
MLLAQALLPYLRVPHPDIKKRGIKNIMAKTLDSEKNRIQINIMDALLYVLAGSTMAIISVSFLLWLRF